VLSYRTRGYCPVTAGGAPLAWLPKPDAGDGHERQKASPGHEHGLQTLKVGSRVRCPGDGVEGRITWANGFAVKIAWPDGETVTW
jgi:hypothetical protein